MKFFTMTDNHIENTFQHNQTQADSQVPIHVIPLLLNNDVDAQQPMQQEE